MDIPSGEQPRSAFLDWIESHRELMRQERGLADLVARVATGSAPEAELDAMNSRVVALRARTEELMELYLAMRTRP